MEITLGKKYTDAVTGFTGIATQRVDYVNGCTHYALEARMDKDGKVPDAEFFDFQRLINEESGVGFTAPQPSRVLLGQKVRDTISGFEGIVVATVIKMNGDVSHGVKPRVDKDGKDMPLQYLSDVRLEHIGEGPKMPTREGGADSMSDAPAGR